VAWVMVEAASNRRLSHNDWNGSTERSVCPAVCRDSRPRAFRGVSVRLNVDLVTNAVQRRQAEMLELLEHVVNLDSPSEDKALADVVGDVFQTRAELLGLTFERDLQATTATTGAGGWRRRIRPQPRRECWRSATTTPSSHSA